MKSIEERRKLKDEYERTYNRSLREFRCVVCHFRPHLRKPTYGDGYRGARRLVFGMAMGRHIMAKHFKKRFDEAFGED